MQEKYIRRFWNKVDKTNSCWNWTAAKWNGYGAYGYRLDGTINTAFKSMSAHRFSYLIAKGDPGDAYVRHICDNPLCVRPEHLELGTHNDNMADMTTRNRSATGIKNAASVLTEEQVKIIKTVVRKGHGGNVKQLSKQYNVSIVSILNIANNIRWSHI
jgi:hypothetical protein